MKWQGLQSVVCKIGLVMYEIHHPDKGKATQIYHINLLNAWKGPPSNPSTLLLIRKVEEDQEEDQPDPKARRPADPAVPLLFRQRPGWTNLVQHRIHLLHLTPFRYRPYRVPEGLMDRVLQGCKEWAAAYPHDVVIYSVIFDTWGRPWKRSKRWASP